MIKQTKQVEKSIFNVENTVDQLLQSGKKIIAVQEIVDIAAAADPSIDKSEVTARIIRELEYHEALLPVVPGESYAAAAEFFAGKEFLIVPDGFEIDHNILIPGHRFVPFMQSDIFPSGITLKEVGARKRQSMKDFSGQAENIIKYHLLMGAETLFDFFAAEADENMTNARNSTNPMLKLAVLDMEKFYKETDFKEGDALLVKVVDYNQGEFEFHLSNGKERAAGKLASYRAKFEDILEKVTEDLQPGSPIIEQIQCTLLNAPELLNNPAMSLDELLIADSKFDIAFDQDGSSLIKRSEEDEFDGDCTCGHDHHQEHSGECSCGHDHGSHDHRLPENVTIGSGETGSLESMLEKLYPMLSMVELDAILLDNLKNHDLDFNSFYSRAFGETALPFADGMQEACFFNSLEERFEEMLESYPREYDEVTGVIRSQIVEFTIDRCTLLAELAEIADELDIKTELFEQLAEVVILLDESLKLVNAPAALTDDFNMDEFRNGVENALETGEEVLCSLREVLDSDD